MTSLILPDYLADEAHTGADYRPVLDLRFIEWESIVRGIRVIGTWLASGTREPCMVLMDARADLRTLDKGCALIRMSNIWKWMIPPEDAINRREIRAYQVHHCHQWVKMGALPGNPDNPKDVWRVFDVINARLPDLFAMPPAPERPRQIVGEATIINVQTGKTRQVEITDDG